MRIFVTGGTGFIGANLLPLLSDHELMCLSRGAASSFFGEKIRYVGGDLGNPSQWIEQVIAWQPEWCIHLAWQGLPDYSLSSCVTNVSQSLGLLEVLAKTNVERIVVAGSCWEYGNANGPVLENAQSQDPVGVFAAGKNAIRAMFEAFGKANGIEIRWARLFFVYGPGQRKTSLIPLCHDAYSRGKTPIIKEPFTQQDFVYIDDAALGLFSLLCNATAGSGIFNIGAGKPIFVADVVNHIARSFRRTPPYPESIKGSGFWANPERMSNATGWRPQVEMLTGIDKTIAWLGR